MGVGEEVLISGVIVQGVGGAESGNSKSALLRARGPSLAIGNKLPDPKLDLYRDAPVPIFSNNNWRESQEQEIERTGLAPDSDLESAMVVTLSAGNYTAIMSGVDGATGVGITEIFDLERESDVRVGNISTRGLVGTENNVLIGGFILQGSGTADVLVRAIGPSLADRGVANVLEDPTLELVDSNGTSISNDNWRSDQEAEIEATTIPPSKDREAAIRASLPSGLYTAIVRGKGNTTGVGMVEIYHLRPAAAQTR